MDTDDVFSNDQGKRASITSYEEICYDVNINEGNRRESIWWKPMRLRSIKENNDNCKDSVEHDMRDECDPSGEEIDHKGNVSDHYHGNLVRSDNAIVASANVDAMGEEVVEKDEVKLDVTSKIELKVEDDKVHVDDKKSNETLDSLAHDAEQAIHARQNNRNNLEAKIFDTKNTDLDTMNDYQVDKVTNAPDPAEIVISTPERRRRVAFEVRISIGYLSINYDFLAFEIRYFY